MPTPQEFQVIKFAFLRDTKQKQASKQKLLKEQKFD
jgi:hypothetical protein